MNRPFSQASENNKAPILDVLKSVFERTQVVLEIGSGTGQHAVYFSRSLPHLFWQTSDQIHYHQGINQWIDTSPNANLGRPFALNVTHSDHWKFIDTKMTEGVDGVFSANTAHIMSWQMVISMFTGVSGLLGTGGCFALYGPFNRDGEFTSISNQEFDASLRRQDGSMGIRDDHDVFKLAESLGFELQHDIDMPANNRTLVFARV